MTLQDIDRILDKLAKDVELAVHALYRGEVRQETAKVRTDAFLRDARSAIAAAVAESGGVTGAGAAPTVSPRPSVAAPAIAGEAFGWTSDDSDAVTKCILAWLPMGGPTSTAADTKCIPAGKMLVPTWGERERAREAVRSITKP